MDDAEPPKSIFEIHKSAHVADNCIRYTMLLSASTDIYDNRHAAARPFRTS